MARILLGTSGGISAYKAVELARLAVKAGHAVRVIQTQDSLRFVGRATFEGITGAPVLVEEFERDPAARRVSRASPRPTTIRSAISRSPRAATPTASRPRPRTRSRSSPPGQADNLLTAAYLACAAPVLVAPAMNNRMYEHAATQANLETLRARGVHVSSPAPASSRRAASGGSAGWPSRPRSSRRSRWSPAARRGRSTACGCWSPPAGRASRSTRCASSATAPAAGWDSRSPPRRRAAAPP